MPEFQEENADVRGSSLQAFCDILDFKHDVNILSCANTQVYSLSLEDIHLGSRSLCIPQILQVVTLGSGKTTKVW